MKVLSLSFKYFNIAKWVWNAFNFIMYASCMTIGADHLIFDDGGGGADNSVHARIQANKQDIYVPVQR